MKKQYLAPVLLGLLLSAGCARKDTEAKAASRAKDPDPVEVKTVNAETRQVEQTIAVTGSLLADESVTISSEVAGRLKAIYFDFGQTVRKGDVIAELDTREFVWRLEKTKAALAQTLARIGLSPGQEEVVPETTPAIRQAEAAYQDAKFRYESHVKLVKSGDISQDRFQELEAAFIARKAALDATRDELKTQLATIQSLRADVKLAQKNLNDATMRAPFDGSVTERTASPGQYLKENTPLMTLVKTNPLRLRVEIPESATDGVRMGGSLAFTTDALPDKEFHAVVRQLNPSLDSKSRFLVAEARLVESEQRLKPGMFVQVKLVTERNATVVVVPRDAVYTVAGLIKVFTIHNDRAVEHKIGPGREVDGWIVVPSNVIRPGDQVAVSNLTRLVDGATVIPKASTRTSQS